MKKIKNKFLWIIILLILSIVGFEVYNSFSSFDRNSYVSVVEGKGLLNDNVLTLNKQYQLKQGDKIQTLGENSLAIIKWGDGSITRLGGNSEMLIKQTDIDKDLLNIQIIFELKKGKTWSDVISFVGGDSYFYQEFADTSAAVRGTIYEVNLEKDYVYVSSHEVELTRNGKKKIIPENKAFDIKRFSFIELLEFLKEYKDKTWQQLNKALDKEFYKEIVKEIEQLNNITVEQLDNLTGLSPEEKERIYLDLKKQYQKLNFLKPDSDLYNTKLELKKYLLELAPQDEKEDLLTTSLYDFRDIINSKQYNFLKTNLDTIAKNIGDFSDLNIDYQNYINIDLIKQIKIPEGLQDEFEKNFKSIAKIFDLGKIDLSGNSVMEFIDYSKESFKNSLNESGILDKIKQALGLNK